MAELCVNVDHVATLRQARGGVEPDPVHAALEVERAGSTGVTIHLREDRRHIQERDLRLIREVVQGHLNLEMAATGEMVKIALEIGPDIVTLVPEKREELTTEGGLDVAAGADSLRRVVKRLRDQGISVSMFIDADPNQIMASREVNAGEIELHTGPYALAKGADRAGELEKLVQGARLAREQGLVLNAGHGLNHQNVAPVAAIEAMRELNIGHAIISRAVFDGLHKSVSDMTRLIREASR